MQTVTAASWGRGAPRQPRNPTASPGDANDRDEKGVEQSNPKRLSVGRQIGIAYQMEIDVEAGDIVPEAEAHRNAAGSHIDHGIIDRAASQRCDACEQQCLVD